MNPLAALFGAGVALRNALYDRGWARTRRLEAPVVSVGNLSTGGSGKTPFVILLGQLLRSRDIEFDVLSRGYGRSSHGVAVVDAAGRAEQFGDEPLLIARCLGVPVVVAEDRYEAGRFAERTFGPRLHLLDDAFQHRQLARDFDIVLVNPEDIWDRLLPAGRLREPMSALSRADAIVLSQDALPESVPLQGKLVWKLRRDIGVERVPPRPVAFCGIARPERFFAQLRAAGVELAAEQSFPDHHRYSRHDIVKLERLRKRSAGGGFVTTEKDVLNLAALGGLLRPIAVASVAMEWKDADSAVNLMLSRIAERRRL
jgi:tetraacyldisaccharide 4'-kinase